MRISKISSNNPNFQARIKINKAGVKNLISNVSDMTKISTHSSASTSSGIAEITAFPADLNSKEPYLLGQITNNSEAINLKFEEISTRNIKTSEIEDPEAFKDMGKSSALVGLGASSTTSGIGSHGAAIASAFDQSAYYPNSSYPYSAYENIYLNAPEKCAIFMEDITRDVNDLLYDQRRSAGNELASLDSTISSGLGYFFNFLGSNAFKTNSEALAKKANDLNKNKTK